VIPDKYHVYDVETFPNVFTMGVSQPSTGDRWMFEISQWQNDSSALIEFLRFLSLSKAQMVGFNNVGFDYPVVHCLMNEHETMDNVPYKLWQEASTIINTDWNDRFVNNINKPYIKQVDLFLIHHFDTSERSASLKLLEFNMRRDTIAELPFEPNTVLDIHQARELKEYNWVDVKATEDFLKESIEMLEFRDHLSAQYGRDFTNFNDAKIGKQIFIIKIEEKQPGTCYNADHSIRQTRRDSIPLSDVIFPYIKFQHPELQRVHDWYVAQTLTEFKDVQIQCEIDGLVFKFGKGGLHASVNDSIIVSTPDVAIIDVDVKGYYPSMAIQNRLHPEHLGGVWCDVYEDIVYGRSFFEKGTMENKAYKLAANGSYGDTGNIYSCFYDLKYLLSITINGQLLLCMLAEHLMQIPNLKMIQVNTDGVTFAVPRTHLDAVKVVTDWWQEYTCHTLEEEEYSRMFIRDVNNYIGEFTDGKLKRKGAYEHCHPKERNPTGWHQDLSALVVPKAAEAKLIRGVNVRQFITQHPDIMDFMLRTKVNRASTIELHTEDHKRTLQRITRYLVTKTGGSLFKVSPPVHCALKGQWCRANKLTDWMYEEVMDEILHTGNPDDWDTTQRPWDARINTKNRSQYKVRQTGIDVGWLVTPHNVIDAPIMRSDINYEYYIQETGKLVDQLKMRL